MYTDLDLIAEIGVIRVKMFQLGGEDIAHLIN